MSWTQKIPSTSPGGKWAVHVTCAHAGSATGRFTVIAKPPPPPPVIPAKVVVVKSGVSTRMSFGDTYVSYGIMLQNASPDEDALDVSLTINYLDANGLIVHSSADTLAGIPAGATYYDGGYDYFFGASIPSRIDVAAVQIGEHQKKALGGLPPVANVRTSDDSISAHVLGDFQNPYTRTISEIASITAVCFDASGNVIGGGSGYPVASVTPGGRTGFDVRIRTLSASQIASAQVSVEPDFTG